jgi:hypothetical protein
MNIAPSSSPLSSACSISAQKSISSSSSTIASKKTPIADNIIHGSKKNVNPGVQK